MSGRHRQPHAGVAQQAWAGAMPVLGVAGAATGLVLSSGAAAAPQATQPAPVGKPTLVGGPVSAPTPPVPSVREHVPGRGGEAVTAVSDASAAVRQYTGRAQLQEQSVNRLVQDVRADALARDAAAARDGRAELSAFEQDQAMARQEAARQDTRLSEWSTPEQEVPSDCDRDGLPRIGSAAGSDEIVERDCGLTGTAGEEQSQDSWTDSPFFSDD